MASLRIDSWLVTKGYFESRNKAAQAIQDGRVLLNDKPVSKSTPIHDQEENIVIVPASRNFVSIGGFKLEKALKYFKLNVSGKLALDVGSSTGGFTDCLLQFGAHHVVAVDVGTNQLHDSLLKNPRVTSLENTDIRLIPTGQLPFQRFDIITADLSFIRLSKILPYLLPFTHEHTELVLLVKPQFEQELPVKSKRGIIKSPELRKKALFNVIKTAQSNGLNYKDYLQTDADGIIKNIEYFLWLNYS
jgi:23S rRNA (cytidine1920-2'-O)/16S rRNA (cytidine1409-2'-O)-methyltransferase